MRGIDGVVEDMNPSYIEYRTCISKTIPQLPSLTTNFIPHINLPQGPPGENSGGISLFFTVLTCLKRRGVKLSKDRENDVICYAGRISTRGRLSFSPSEQLLTSR